ncbi:MAG TPA: MauE/DoxX family redox-associated membrane protein [Blastocatellia bacterium]|nr:MauE/DoxX family redox-associated membrane protein [Blastocatellia bacterium]
MTFSLELSESRRLQARSMGTWLLGVAFTAAATLKAIDLPAFIAQIARYGLLPESAVAPIAIAVIVAEASLGLACILGLVWRPALGCMLALLLIFSAATVLKWQTLQGTNCNCFGNLTGGGPASVILHDAILAALAIGVLFITRKAILDHPRRILRIMTGGVAILATLFVTQSSSAGDSLLRLGPDTEDQMRIFLSATCKHCQESLEKVQELRMAPGLPTTRVFIGANNQQEISDFLRDVGPDFEYTPLTFRQLGNVVPRVPTVQFVHSGKVESEWSAQVPTVDEATSTVREKSSEF